MYTWPAGPSGTQPSYMGVGGTFMKKSTADRVKALSKETDAILKRLRTCLAKSERLQCN